MLEQLLLDPDVLDDRLDHEVGGHDLVHRRHARENLVGVRPSLLGELRQAPRHSLERALDGARLRVVQRDVPAGCGDDLRDPRPHLSRPDDEDVRKGLPGGGHRGSLGGGGDTRLTLQGHSARDAERPGGQAWRRASTA